MAEKIKWESMHSSAPGRDRFFFRSWDTSFIATDKKRMAVDTFADWW